MFPFSSSANGALVLPTSLFHTADYAVPVNPAVTLVWVVTIVGSSLENIPGYHHLEIMHVRE